MRKFMRPAIAGAAIIGVFVLAAPPASADCAKVSGTQNPIITVSGPFGPTTIYAPGNVDVTPRDCITVVEELLGG